MDYQQGLDSRSYTGQDWTERAQEYCDRVESPRKVAEVQRQLESVQTALKERERRYVSA